MTPRHLPVPREKSTKTAWVTPEMTVMRFTMANAHNACHNGLGEMAAFLRFFAKMVTACPSPIAGTC